MNNRRNFIQSIPLIAFSTTFTTKPVQSATRTIPTARDIASQAQALAKAVALKNGGEWKITIDEVGGFILIARRQSTISPG